MLGLCLGGFWFVGALGIIEFTRNYRLTDRVQSLPPLSDWPLVSVVVPAKNEEEKIEENLRSLLNMDYPHFEIIAVDDRSEDKTGAIMDKTAKKDERLKVIHIKELPDRWLGKTHAMHKASQAAKGEFVLFTDGDIIFEKDALRLSIQYVTHHKLDHLCLVPELTPGGYWERVMISFFGLIFLLSIRPWAVNRKKSLYAGIGAFNLVRKTAYDEIGGHKRLRLEVIDDVKLGKAVKHSGFSQDMLTGDGFIRLRWHNGVKGYITGMEKNGFAMIEYSIIQLILLSLLSGVLVMAPYIGILTFSDARIFGYALAFLAMHGVSGYGGAKARYGWRVTFGLPFAAIIFFWILWRSAIITLRQGGVKWRDTFYSLDVLRDGQNIR
jgi:glycosyltransferase involved in cell wall biosynthesis